MGDGSVSSRIRVLKDKIREEIWIFKDLNGSFKFGIPSKHPNFLGKAKPHDRERGEVGKHLEFAQSVSSEPGAV